MPRASAYTFVLAAPVSSTSCSLHYNKEASSCLLGQNISSYADLLVCASSLDALVARDRGQGVRSRACRKRVHAGPAGGPARRCAVSVPLPHPPPLYHMKVSGTQRRQALLLLKRHATYCRPCAC